MVTFGRISLLALAFCAACRAPAKHVDDARLDVGYTGIVVGVMGNKSGYTELEKGLVAGGMPGAVEVIDWTLGPLGIFINLHGESRARREAQKVADQIVRYQDDYPGRPVHLLGHSGGTGFVTFVLEALPEGRTITSAHMLGSAMPCDYNLTAALKKTDRGIWNWYCKEDWLYLSTATGVFGTFCGGLGDCSGLAGYEEPKDLTAEGKRLYRTKLHEISWEEWWKSTGHKGGHWGTTRTEFAKQFLVPALRNATTYFPQHTVQLPGQ